MELLAIFRIEDIKNDALQTAASISLLVLGVLYLSLIFWTFADARRRIDDPLLVMCATLAYFELVKFAHLKGLEYIKKGGNRGEPSALP